MTRIPNSRIRMPDKEIQEFETNWRYYTGQSNMTHLEIKFFDALVAERDYTRALKDMLEAMYE